MTDLSFDPQSLDLANLREITGGDTELEQLLFATYLESSQINLSKLEAICGDGEQIEWKEASHALKGESANLGAVKLTSLCQESQVAYTASKAEKEKLLAAIKTEWLVIKGYLEQLQQAG